MAIQLVDESIGVLGSEAAAQELVDDAAACIAPQRAV
jgi:hypothetical protein